MNGSSTTRYDRRDGGVGLDVYALEPLRRSGHPASTLFGRDNVILFPHLTFFTDEAMRRLEDDTLARCCEILDGRPVTVRSRDPRLRAQRHGVVFDDGTRADPSSLDARRRD